MGVEVPYGCGKESAPEHRDRVPVDDSPYALTLDDEPEGILGVPVRWTPAEQRVGQFDRPAITPSRPTAPGSWPGRP